MGYGDGVGFFLVFFWGVGGGQGGCERERRIEVIVKNNYMEGSGSATIK